MTDIIIFIIIAIILAGAIFYIRKEKKRGVKCIGCSFCSNCSDKQHEDSKNCGCSSHK